MTLKGMLGGVATAVLLAGPAAAQAAVEPAPTPQVDQGPGDRIDEAQYRGAPGAQGMRQGPQQGPQGRGFRHRPMGRSLLGMILRRREELGLSTAQVQSLERLRGDYVRDTIRRQADLGIARLDLMDMMRPDPSDPGKAVDAAKVETKIREIERMRGDMQLTRIRAIEAGKAQLTAEQKSKLAAIVKSRWQRGGAPARIPAPMPRS